MSIEIKGGHSISEVDVNSNNELKINLFTGITDVGYMSVVGEVDSGSIIGTKTIRPIYVTQDFRINRNLEKPLWNDTFNHSVINNNKYNVTTTNQTIDISNGFLNLNSSNSITSGDYCLIKTFKYFSLVESAPLYLNVKGKFSTTLQNNSVIEFGVGIVTGVSNPTDGIFFRASAGTMNAVVVKNGYEMFNVNIQTPVANVVYDYLIAINGQSAEFWVDDIIVSRVTVNPITGSTSLSHSLPLFIRNRNSGTVPSAIQFKVAVVDVLFGDLKLNKNWGTMCVLNGQSSISKTDGQPSASTGTTSANLFNSTQPDVVSLNNTTAGYVELGGQFSINAPLESEDDLILFSYLNPIGTNSIPAKSLIVNNIYIDTFTSGTTMGATSTLFQWYVGVGGTSQTLLEVDSLVDGTRASRKIGLGIQSISANTIAGTMAEPSIESKSTPFIVEAGTYFHIILKIPIGLATPSLIYRGLVNVNGYYE